MFSKSLDTDHTAVDMTSAHVCIGELTGGPEGGRIDVLDYLIDRYGILLTSNDASEVLGCHPSHVRAMCADQILPAIKVGDRWRIPATRLAAFIEGVE